MISAGARRRCSRPPFRHRDASGRTRVTPHVRTLGAGSSAACRAGPVRCPRGRASVRLRPRPPGGASSAGRERCRNGEPHHGAADIRGFGPDDAAVRLDDLAAHSEADSAPLDVVAVRALEHREDVVGQLGRDADAVVADVEQPAVVVALGGHGDARWLVGVELEPVGHQVLKDPAELGMVGADGRQPRDLESPVEPFDRAGQRRRDVGHELGGVDRVHREARAAAGVLEHPVNQRARSRMGSSDALEQLLVLRRAAVCESLRQQVGEEAGGHDRLAQIVRRDVRVVAKLVFHAPLLGEVRHQAQHAVGPKWDHAVQKGAAHPPDGPAARSHRYLHRLGPARLDNAGQALIRLVLGELRHLGEQAPADACLERNTDCSAHRRIRVARLEVGDRARAIAYRPHDPDGIREEVERRSERARAVAEQRLQSRVRRTHVATIPRSPAMRSGLVTVRVMLAGMSSVTTSSACSHDAARSSRATSSSACRMNPDLCPRSGEPPSDWARATARDQATRRFAHPSARRGSRVESNDAAARSCDGPRSTRIVQSSSGSHPAAGCNRRAAAATEGAGLSCGASRQAVTSRRVTRQAPIRSGSTIQMTSEVPACAHWVGLMTSTVIWPRARALSTHGGTPANTGSESTAIHDIGSAKRRTMAGVGASRTAPNATPTTIPAVRLTADWPISGAASDQVPSTPGDETNTPAATTATDIASIATASRRLAMSLAPRTRERTGTSANVISPVRWDDSEVTSRMPRTGSRTADGCSPASRTDWNVWSAASPTSKRTTTTTTVSATMATCSQKPARVSTILRSSTATRRPRPGRAWTPAVFTRIGAERGVVLTRLLLPARG